MGAVDVYVVLDPDSKSNLISEYNRRQQDPYLADLESETEGYGGTINQLDRRVKFVTTIMDNERMTVDYISDNAKKRKDSLKVILIRRLNSSVKAESN